jgi:hypothetical protein
VVLWGLVPAVMSWLPWSNAAEEDPLASATLLRRWVEKVLKGCEPTPSVALKAMHSEWVKTDSSRGYPGTIDKSIAMILVALRSGAQVPILAEGSPPWPTRGGAAPPVSPANSGERARTPATSTVSPPTPPPEVGLQESPAPGGSTASPPTDLEVVMAKLDSVMAVMESNTQRISVLENLFLDAQEKAVEREQPGPAADLTSDDNMLLTEPLLLALSVDSWQGIVETRQSLGIQAILSALMARYAFTDVLRKKVFLQRYDTVRHMLHQGLSGVNLPIVKKIVLRSEADLLRERGLRAQAESFETAMDRTKMPDFIREIYREANMAMGGSAFREATAAVPAHVDAPGATPSVTPTPNAGGQGGGCSHPGRPPPPRPPALGLGFTDGIAPGASTCACAAAVASRKAEPPMAMLASL